jgi:hypothetical protein
MVDKELSLRGKAARERLERIKAARPPSALGVRVVPATDVLRKVLKHPRGARFPSEGSAEWPNDTFTKRRLKEGAVTLEQSQQSEQEHNGKEQSEKKPRGRHAESTA